VRSTVQMLKLFDVYLENIFILLEPLRELRNLHTVGTNKFA